jgi:ubiquinone biosynthesis protein
VFFEAQKLRVRADRVLESLERVIGARPGVALQVEMTRNAELTAVIERTVKRIAWGLSAAAAAVAGGVVVSEVRRARR